MKPGAVEIQSPVLVLIGPTAIGKTALSLAIAKAFSCEIISMDSMQVYRYMDIGTAKVRPEEMDGTPHYLIDIVNPDEQYNAAAFCQDALHQIQEISARGNIPLLTGGTGLYLRALTQGLFSEPAIPEPQRQQLRQQFASRESSALHQELEQIDPQSAQRIHPNDRQRLTRALELYHSTGKTWSEHLQEQKGNTRARFATMLKIGLQADRDRLAERIAQRSRNMLAQGLVEEVATLRNRGYAADLPSMQAIGYRQANDLLDGRVSKDTALETLITDTRHYAKRQMTWFRADQEICWFANEDNGLVMQTVEKFLHAHQVSYQ